MTIRPEVLTELAVHINGCADDVFDGAVQVLRVAHEHGRFHFSFTVGGGEEAESEVAWRTVFDDIDVDDCAFLSEMVLDQIAVDAGLPGFL